MEVGALSNHKTEIYVLFHSLFSPIHKKNKLTDFYFTKVTSKSKTLNGYCLS